MFAKLLCQSRVSLSREGEGIMREKDQENELQCVLVSVNIACLCAYVCVWWRQTS